MYHQCKSIIQLYYPGIYILCMKCAKPSYAFALAMHIKDINKTKQNIGLLYPTHKIQGFCVCLIKFNELPTVHLFFISRGAEGPGREILQRPPSVRLSVRLSVTFSFRTVTQKRIAVFSRNFAGTCTKSWGCAV